MRMLLFFDMKISRKPEYNMDAKKYRFVILDPGTLAPSVASGVSVYPVSRKSTVLGVSYTGTVPQRVQEFSVALAKVYLEQSVERRTWEASKTIVLIDRQIERIELNILGYLNMGNRPIAAPELCSEDHSSGHS